MYRPQKLTAPPFFLEPKAPLLTSRRSRSNKHHHHSFFLRERALQEEMVWGAGTGMSLGSSTQERINI